MIPNRADAGSATVEMAVALPAVVLVLSVLLTVVQFGAQRVRVERAGAVAARMASLDMDRSQIAAVVRTVAGDAAQVSVTAKESWVSVEVTKPVVGSWMRWNITASYVAPHEDYIVGSQLADIYDAAEP